jgi:DNA-directed RNA polymerase specialized sigma subunit
MKFLSEAHKNDFVQRVQKNKGKLIDIKEILSLLKKGLTQTEVAELYGVSRQSISKLVLKYKRS